MTNKTMNAIIENAKSEAGIKKDEYCSIKCKSSDENLYEITMETEWSTAICYADKRSGEILGLMSEPKRIEAVFLPERRWAQTASGSRAA